MIGSGGSLFWSLRILGIGATGKRTRKKHIMSAVTVVALSVIPLIIAMFLVNGMTIGITRKYINLSSFHAQVYGVTDPAAFAAEAEKLEGAAEAFEIREAYSLLYSQNGSYTTMVKAAEAAYYDSPAFQDELSFIAGSSSFSSRASIMISETIANELEVTIDDTIAVVTVTQQMGETRLKPAIFLVTGIFASGYKQLDAQLAYVDIDQSQRIMKDDNRWYMGILAEPGYENDLPQLRQSLMGLVDEQGRVVSWDQLNRSLYSNFRSSKTILYVIMILIILVASINISSTCIIIIQEKYLEIGMLKSVGVDNRILQRTFLYTSLLIGTIGAVIGISLGVLISLQLQPLLVLLQDLGVSALDFYLIDIPVIFHWDEIALVGIMTIAISGLSSILPLRRVKSMLPIHLLQE